MSSLIQTVEYNVDRLRAALPRQDRNEKNRAITALESSLLDNDAYKIIGDERILATALRLIFECYGEARRPQLEGLREHLELIRAVHDRFFAILDHTVDLDSLLYESLAVWPLVAKPISCQFGHQDRDDLHQVRSTGSTEQRLENFLSRYFQLLGAKGCGEIVALLEHPVEIALEGYKHMHSAWTVYGLFTISDTGEVYGIKVRAEGNGQGAIKALGSIGPEMQKAADRALVCVQEMRPQTRVWNFTWEIGRDDSTFEGTSIGLALTIGILSKVDAFDIDPYTGWTGHVDWASGQVRAIDQINAKLQGAKELGIRRVFLPDANTPEVHDPSSIRLVPVQSIADARQQLISQTYSRTHTDLARLALAKIRELEVELSTHGLRVTVSDEVTYKRVKITDYREEALLLVYHAKELKVVPGGKPNTRLQNLVTEVADRVFGIRQTTETKNTTPSGRMRDKYSVQDPNIQRQVEKHIFARHEALREDEKNCAYRAKIFKGNQTVFVRQFRSGTLTVDGDVPLFHEINDGIRAILGVIGMLGNEGVQTKVQEQVRAVEAVDLGEKWVGSDEAGKGDYFGPLVSSAVLLDQQQAELLEGLGVRDSKNLSDNRNRELAAQILKLCGKRAQVVIIPPSRYNALYEEFRREGKNLNTLLAWAHTRALENILVAFPQEHLTVLVDKFADEKEILGKLLTEARSANLRIVQLPKAEANVAVAAASILARAHFLEALEGLAKRYGIELPKGASDPRIPDIGKQIVARWGQSELAKVAKLHFKTTERILGTTMRSP